MAETQLAVTVDGPRTTISLDRPERRNALSLELMREFLAALDAIDDSCAVVVVDAHGPAFSAGHDLAEMTGRDDGFYAELFAVCTEMMLRLHDVPQPVIARVQGGQGRQVVEDLLGIVRPRLVISVRCGVERLPQPKAVLRCGVVRHVPIFAVR